MLKKTWFGGQKEIQNVFIDKNGKPYEEEHTDKLDGEGDVKLSDGRTFHSVLRESAAWNQKRNAIKDFLLGLLFLGFVTGIVSFHEVRQTIYSLIPVGIAVFFFYLGWYVCLKGALKEWKIYRRYSDKSKSWKEINEEIKKINGKKSN